MVLPFRQILLEREARLFTAFADYAPNLVFGFGVKNCRQEMSDLSQALYRKIQSLNVRSLGANDLNFNPQ